MSFVVLQNFADLSDKNRKIYRVGDTYPNSATKKRIAQLLSDNQADHQNFATPLIKEVADEPKEDDKQK